jgi:hypothetical protein
MKLYRYMYGLETLVKVKAPDIGRQNKVLLDQFVSKLGSLCNSFIN